MTCAVVAVQGAFIEHERRLAALGEEVFEIRQASDLEKPFSHIVLPGGESTTQGKLLRELGLLVPLRDKILDGVPVLGTCAGLILLAQAIDGRGDLRCGGDASFGSNAKVEQLGTLPVTVMRNGYGRQSGSFKASGFFAGKESIPMTFIRAPRITQVNSSEAEMIAEVEGAPVAVRFRNQLGVAFHPELDDDPRLLEYFLSMQH